MFSLFWEEISACVEVHTRYVMDTCERVRSIIHNLGHHLFVTLCKKDDCQLTQTLSNLIT